MNIILIRDGHTPARCLRLNHPSNMAAIACVAAVVLTVFGGLCFAIGRYWGDAAGISRAEIDGLREALDSQQVVLAETSSRAERDLQALATELGKLQAESMRLNSLGQRLTRLGGIDDGEFDFDSQPAVGGPEMPSVRSEGLVSTHFHQSMDELRQRFAAQNDQLRVLESLLIGRELDSVTQPAGSPIKGGYVSSGYGVRHDPFTGRSTFHAGIDFDGPRGGEIFAVASGVVTWSGRRPGYGLVVEIDHGNGYMTRYAHNQKNLVEVGDRVNVDQVIGEIGSTGRSTGTHVHFELWQDGKPVNPSKFTQAIRGQG